MVNIRSCLFLRCCGKPFSMRGCLLQRMMPCTTASYRSTPGLTTVLVVLSLRLYGWLSYRTLRQAHWQHHQSPASRNDPDFHDGRQTHRVFWYVRFMRRYWGWSQLIVVTATYHVLSRVVHVAEMNLILFWAVPSLLSSLQLFYFGTFLAHREPIEGYQNPSRANSIYRPLFWSLLTCYHFGYHQEHHESPHVPWWQLPNLIDRSHRSPRHP